MGVRRESKFQALYEGSLRHLLAGAFHRIPCKDPVLSRLRGRWSPPESAVRWLRYRGEFEVQLGRGRTFKLLSDGEHIESSIFWTGITGSWEKVSLGLWIRLCEALAGEEAVILDVGANTGVYALVAKTLAPRSKVAGFEPVPRIFNRFQANDRLNGLGIECVEAAVSDRDGLGSLHDPGGHVYGLSLNDGPDAGGIRTREVRVRTLRLDSFLRDRKLDRLDLLKLDIEGHEPEALAGLGDRLRVLRPTLLVEITSQKAADSVGTMLEGLGYLYFDIDERTSPRKAERLRKSSKWNFLVCQPEIASNLGLE